MGKMAKQGNTQKTDDRPQNPEPSKLEKATEELRKAEIIYHELVRLDTAKMDMEEIDKHQQACQTALAAKRAAQKAVEDAKKGM
jgi:hypothetical protein